MAMPMRSSVSAANPATKGFKTKPKLEARLAMFAFMFLRMAESDETQGATQCCEDKCSHTYLSPICWEDAGIQ